MKLNQDRPTCSYTPGEREIADKMGKELSTAQDENEYLRWRIKEMDLLFGKMLLAMRASVIEHEHGKGAEAGMEWIVNALFGPGEFAPEEEKDAQAYFNREAEIIDVEFSKCMDFFQSWRKAGSDDRSPSDLPSV